MTVRYSRQIPVFWLSCLLVLSGCDATTESSSMPTDAQLKSRVEAVIASASDLPQGLIVSVSRGAVMVSGDLNCEDCGGLRTPGNVGTVQQSLGAIVRAVPGVSDVQFALGSNN